MAANRAITRYRDAEGKPAPVKRALTRRQVLDRWFDAEGDKAALQLTSQAARLETDTWNNRYMEYICSRLMTGRASLGAYGYSMSPRSGRVADVMSYSQYIPPALNVVAVCADVFINKTFSLKPFIVFSPVVQGSAREREQCKMRGMYVDAAFKELDVYTKAKLAAYDCMQYQSGYLLVDRDLAGNIQVERVLSAEVLDTPEDQGSFGKTRSRIVRRFMDRSDAILKYAKGNRAQEIANAIDDAPGVFSGMYKSPTVNYDAKFALAEGWSLPSADGKPGRHVVAVGRYALVDEPWTRDHFPLAQMDFQPLSNESKGMSMAEILLPLQRSIDRLSAAIDECEQRVAWPRYFIESSSNVDSDQFAGPGFVEYTGQAPQPDRNATPKELYSSLEAQIARAFTRVGVSQGAAGNEKEPGLSSGLAIIAYNQVTETRHVDLGQRYEKLILDTARLILEECEVADPAFKVMGKQAIKWSDLKGKTSEYSSAAFPVSRLSQSISAKLQQIQGWYDEGSISRDEKMRLEDVPTGAQGCINLKTAAADWVERALDKCVFDKEFTAPSPYLDYPTALRDAQARFLWEQNRGAADAELTLIAKFISALQERSKAMAPLAPAPQAPLGAPTGPAPGPAGAPPSMLPPNPAAPVA